MESLLGVDIDNLQSDELKWHYFIDCIFFNPTRYVGIFLDAMHVINKYFPCSLFS